MSEDDEEFISVTLRTRNSKRSLRMLARSWKHQSRSHFGSSHFFVRTCTVFFPFRSVSGFALSKCLQTSFLCFLCVPFVLMATARTSDDALHTSLPGSPPLSSNVGSPHGSGHDLDGMGTHSGSTLDEQLDALLSKFVHFEAQIAQNSCSHDMDVPYGFTYLENTWRFRESTHRDGKEFQCHLCTYVQIRDICCLSIKGFRFGKILAYTRTC